jgi:hypothetical protein
VFIWIAWYWYGSWEPLSNNLYSAKHITASSPPPSSPPCPLPPKKSNDVEARILTSVLHRSVQEVTPFRQAGVPWSFRGSQCLNLQGPAVQEERLKDSYVKGTTALCNIRDYSPNQTASHPGRLQCSCRWSFIKITCTNSGSCYWYMQLTKQYEWKRCEGVTPQQCTTTGSRLRNTNERGVRELHLSSALQQAAGWEIQPVASGLFTMACQKWFPYIIYTHTLKNVKRMEKH